MYNSQIIFKVKKEDNEAVFIKSGLKADSYQKVDKNQWFDIVTLNRNKNTIFLPFICESEELIDDLFDSINLLIDLFFYNRKQIRKKIAVACQGQRDKERKITADRISREYPIIEFIWGFWFHGPQDGEEHGTNYFISNKKIIKSRILQEFPFISRLAISPDIFREKYEYIDPDHIDGRKLYTRISINLGKIKLK